MPGWPVGACSEADNGGRAPRGPVVFVGELEPSGREPCSPASCDEDIPARSGMGGQEGHALGLDGPDLRTEICLRGSGRGAACGATRASVLLKVTSVHCLVREGAFGMNEMPVLLHEKSTVDVSSFLEVLLFDTVYKDNQITG